MVENVQCPVCTLFLHAGMNLSDHLETHPKEQVIKALVQLTISNGGSGSGIGSNVLKAALSGETKTEEQDSSTILKSENEMSRSNSRLSTISTSSTLCSTSSSLIFPTSFSTQSTPQPENANDAKTAQNYSNETRLSNSITNSTYDQHSLNSNESYPSRGGVPNDKTLNYNAIKAMNFRRYHHQQQQQQQQQQLLHQQQEQSHSQEQKLQIQSHLTIPSQLQNAHEQHQPLSLSKQNCNTQQQQQHHHMLENRATATQHLPPPPPPLPAHRHHVQQQQNAHQVTQPNTDSLISTTSTKTFPTPQHGLYASIGQRQQHVQLDQHNLYSGGTVLPPPPSLQLFSFQQQSTQHQKPPPAYGAAISQIRSQQNQNKQNIPISSPFLYSQAQHSHLQRHATNNPPRIVSHVSSELTTSTTTATFTTTAATSSTSSSSASPSTVKHIVQEKSSSTGILYAYDQKTSNEILKIQQHSHQYRENRQQQITNANAKNSDATTTTSSSSSILNSARGSTHSLQNAEELNEKLPPPPPLPPAHSSSSSSKSTVAPLTSYSSAVNVNYTTTATNSRQSSSPFTSLLSAPSPSSVLRFAESPVAHYLERDNGDFIVQETPKHIVECVEEEDGEFSVIERFHQSPPSVLHIHDDKDDDDDDADDRAESHSEETDKKTDSASANTTKKRPTSKKDSSDCQDEREFLSLKSDDDEQEEDEEVNEQTSVKRKNASSSTSSSTCSEAESNSSSNSNTLDRSSKKSSKNSITVLSDVQLNLNEYLDLVGNIIASSKIAKRRTTFTASAPIPLVKVEKVELPDDEYDASLAENDIDDANLSQTSENVSHVSRELSSSHTQQPAQSYTTANRRETEQLLVEHSNSKYEHTNHHVKSENSQASKGASEKSTVVTNLYTKDLMTPMAPGTSSHVTSVIRMATTSATIASNEQKQQQQRQEQQPQQPLAEFNHEKSPTHQQHNSAVTKTTTTSTATMSSGFSNDDNAMAQDLSQPQKAEKTSTDETDSYAKQDAYSCGLPPPPPLRKGPKKLVIKPKSTKTEENAKNVDFNEAKVFNDMPTTTSRLMQMQRDQISQSESSTLTQTQDLVIKFEPSNYEIICSTDHKSEFSHFSEHQKESNEDKAQDQPEQSPQPKATDEIKCKTEKNSQPEDSGSIFSQSQSESQFSVSNEAVDYRPIKSERPLNTNDFGSQENERTKSRTIPDKENSATEDARVLLDFANSSKCAAGNINTVSGGSFFSSHSLFSGCTSSRISEHSNAKTETSSNSAAAAGSSIESSLRCEDEFIAVDEHELHEIISSTYSRSAVSTNSREQHKQHTQAQSQVEQQLSPNQQHSQQQQEPQQQQQQQPHSSFAECPFSFFYNGATGSGTGTGIEPVSKNQFSPTYHQTPDVTTTAATVASSSTLDTLDDSISTPAESNALHSRFGSVQGTLPQWYQSATLVANSDFESALSIDNAAVDGDVGKYLDLDACKRENSSSGIRIAPSSTQSSFAAATDSSMPGGCTTNDTLNIRTDEKMPPKGEISEQESNCDIDNSWSQPVYGEIPSKFYRTSFPGIFPQDNGWNHEEFFTVQDLSHAASAAPTTNNSAKSVKSFDFHLPLEATPTTFANSNLQLLHDDVFPSTSLGIKKKRKRVSSDSSNKSKPTATITSQQFLQHAQMTATQNFSQEPTTHQQPNPTTSSAALMASSSASTSAAPQAKPRKKVYKCPHCSTEFSKLRDRNSHMIDSHNYVRQNRRLISSQATSTVVGSQNSSAVISAGETLLNFRSNATGRAEELLLDSKHNIKIEMEYEQQSAVPTNSQSILHPVDTKSELIEEKQSLTALGDSEALCASTEDKKPNLSQSHALTAPTTKLATLYRMLVSYNVSTLKQNQNLTEFDEKLIESSIFFCYICHTNFSSVKLYDAHLTEHPAECFTCGKKFQRWKNFSLHLKRHLGWKEFACTVCDKKFVVRSALVEHTRMHTGHTPLKCKVCGKCFKRYSNLTQHRKRHGRVHVRKKEYVCHCGEVLPSKARFLWHKETHDSKPKCCPHCCDRFVHANSLRRHIRLAHSDKFDYAEPMECPMCKQVFAKSSIKAHMATHSMDTQHDCKICNKSFSTKWNLKIHLWVHANRTAKPFKCEHCPKAFVREVDFKNHMNAHKQIKPYTCEYCGCKFIRKYNYMRHRREHHGNKKFTCELCKKSFHRHYYLIEHRRIHTGERPFQCTICGKSSTTKTNHNKHLKIHHSRDPFTVEA